MEGRRRLLLLAVIIVAVAIGAVGITLVSLFGAGLSGQRQLIESRLSVGAAAVELPHAVTLVVRDGRWQPADDHDPLPANLASALPAPDRLAPGAVSWLDPTAADSLAAVRRTTDRTAIVAWVSLAEFRAPFQRAALQSAAGLLLLVGLGLFLFYRMTAPLLQRLARSEARYRTLFSSTAEGVLLVGERIEECNDRFLEMFGCRREDAVGQPWRDFFRRFAGGEEGLAGFEARVRAEAGSTAGDVLWDFVRPDGTRLVAEVALRTLRDGQRSLVLASLRDVTLREESARALRAAEHALRDSRDRLAQAGRSQTLVELAAGIAHEVNQPLAAIANYAQASRRMVAAGRPCSDDLLQALDRIAGQAQRAGESIHRIRALLPATPAPGSDITCINRLVEEVVELMREDVAAAGAALEVRLDRDAPPVKADPLQIKQVLVQLLRNALDAVVGADGDDRRVLVATSVLPGDGVEVRVEDSGHGIRAEDHQRLFEPFFSTRENGMGMGLAMSLSIVRSHNGELVVDEHRDHGACFRFRLPGCRGVPGSEDACRDKVAP